MADIFEEEAIRKNIGGFDKLSPAKKERMRVKRVKQAERRKKKSILQKADDFDGILKEAIKLFSDGNFEHGAEAIIDLSHVWRAGGQSKESWLQLMEYMERTVCENTGFESTRLQIKEALKKKTGKAGLVIIQ